MKNTDQLAAYHALAEEIWRQTGGGSTASCRASAPRPRCAAPPRRCAGTQGASAWSPWSPPESAVLSGGPAGAHKIDGIGAGFVVPLWQGGIADAIERVSTEEAVAMALRLAREEGIFAGLTGANVIAALRLAERLGPGATVVTVVCDSGMKYLRRLRRVRQRSSADGEACGGRMLMPRPRRVTAFACGGPSFGRGALPAGQGLDRPLAEGSRAGDALRRRAHANPDAWDDFRAAYAAELAGAVAQRQ